MGVGENKIGSGIAALRKMKGLTQEQLADMLGVSAPAVSKWETGSSYPDISLLCPLARALDTNVDSLLGFDENLSTEELGDMIRAVFDLLTGAGAEEDRIAAGESKLSELLRRYPNSDALKLNAALSYDSFTMLFPGASEEKRQNWRKRKTELMEQLRRTGGSAYRQLGTMQLASLAVMDGELKRAEELLKELPEYSGDPTMIWVQLYLKQGKALEALKITQRSLYRSVAQVLSYLSVLTLPELEGSLERCEKAAGAYGKLARTFGFSDLSCGLMIEPWLRRGDRAKAAECFESYADAFAGEPVRPDADFFSPGLEIKEDTKTGAVSDEALSYIRQKLREDEQLKELEGQPAFLRAMEKLRAADNSR